VKPLVFIAILVASLSIASSAWAKGCVHIDVASSTPVGESVRLTVRTYTSKVVSGRVAPGRAAWIPLPRFDLTAERPDGRQFRFTTRMSGQERVARITFGTTGTWRVWATNWEYAPRSCARPAVVRVLPRDA
jgi:hypothetical protein